MSDQEDSENIIELERDADGVYKPARVSTRKKVPRTKSARRKETIAQVSKAINIPEVEQFLYGANAAFDLFERAKKVFK